MTSEKMSRKDKNQNIQVFVRLRPMNQRERDIRSIGVVEVVNNREVVVRQSQQTQLTKKFTFDRAFGPNAKQVEIYQDVVSPLIEEVLAGYNCTVFAYGQTGTGKTHTMVGEHTSDGTTWQNDPLAGIIPRALSQLFDELRLSNTEYTVRVSYLELYNEELFDLLSTSEDNSKLRIYEDVTRKGSNIVNGLEEITVYNKNEVYKIMAQGQDRKRVACTLMNAQSSNHPNGNDHKSSRSHTVFTIVVHMKENSPEGEELVKIGKLNLVDLAGSENISKAGSDNPAKKERARECVNINQSLLTLGRVITALVERHPHIPYRESKLTRILQESLGGRTKTSIIATVSPGHKDLEETMSTLEYAHRAKNIQNKPEINQKLTKKAILKEYAEEIDRLKRDLQATRDKNGVYLASETYEDLTMKQEEQKKEIQELLLQKKSMEDARDKMEAIFNEVSETLQQKETQLDITKRRLDATQDRLATTNNELHATRVNLDEQRHLVSVVSETEKTLSTQASSLLQTADVATTHLHRLHDTVDRRRVLESSNLEVTKTYSTRSKEHREFIQDTVHSFSKQADGALMQLITALETHCKGNITSQTEIKIKIEELAQNLTKTVEELKSLSESKQNEISSTTSTKKSELHNTMESYHKSVEDTLYKVVQGVTECVRRVISVDKSEMENVDNYLKQWYGIAQGDLRAISESCGGLVERMEECGGSRRRRAVGRTSAAQNRTAADTELASRHHQELQSQKEAFEQRLTKLEQEIENKRNETAARIDHWIERERQIFEQRIQNYRQEELDHLERSIAEKQQELDEQRRQFYSMMESCDRAYEQHCEYNKEEIKMADALLKQAMEEEDACIKIIKEYQEKFKQGCASTSRNIDDLNNTLMGVVRALSEKVTDAVHRTQLDVERDVKTAIATDQQISTKVCTDAEVLIDEIVHTNAQTMDMVLLQVKETSTSTQLSLSSLSAASSSISGTVKEHQMCQGGGLERMRNEVEQLQGDLDAALHRQADMEEVYLRNEYKVYKPTGSTPVRQEYRYPRVLAATSPHDRILKRYRDNNPNTNNDDDCIILDDSESRTCSDSASTSSDDSALFTEPSPPNQDNYQISKSTSDTKIYKYNQDKNRGKENSESSIVLTKKPSRLPAPLSVKKPLVERNTPC